jgi:hypothetical protein
LAATTASLQITRKATKNRDRQLSNPASIAVYGQETHQSDALTVNFIISNSNLFVNRLTADRDDPSSWDKKSCSYSSIEMGSP